MKITIHREQGERFAASLDVSFDPAEVRLVETPFGVLVKLDGFTAAGEVGGPALPEKTVRVALPPNARIVGVAVEPGAMALLRGPGTLVAPLQRPGLAPREPVVERRGAPRPSTFMPLARARRPLPPPQPITPIRPELYRQERAAPRQLACLVDKRRVGHNPLAALRLAPVQQDAEGRLVLHTHFTVRVDYAIEAPARRLPAQEFRGQARRAIDLASALVVNPAAIARTDILLPVGEAEYLIITDNQRWDAATKTPLGPVQGDMVQAFRRLRDWKRARGLSARVVTVAQIVASHGADARDLQEAIRNYLKDAHRTLGTAWVLLGGDVSVIPVRSVVGSSWPLLTRVDAARPDDEQYSWSGAFMRLHWARAVDLSAVLRVDTGAEIPARSGGAGPGWYYVTDDTYQTASGHPTRFVRIDGDPAVVDGPIMGVMWDNTIPTDLYYASLVGAGYGQPGRHDWDLDGNGYHGQYNRDGSLDGVAYQADVSVGRAPSGGADEADVFVDKVIAYEQGLSRSGAPLARADLSRVAYIASAWGGRDAIWPVAAAPLGSSYQAIGADAARIQLASPPASLEFRLLAQLSDIDLRELPYSRHGRGYYFAVSATSTSASELSYLGNTIPVPTRWLIVHGDAAEVAPMCFILDDRAADESMTATEALRVQIEADFRFTGATRLYDDAIDLGPGSGPGAQQLTDARLRDALEAGPHLVCLSGHGYWDSLNCGLDQGMARALQNDALFIAYADSCLTNRFDFEDAIGESLMNNPHGGAVAYIGNTRYSWICVGDDFERGFFHALARLRHLGLAHDVRCSMLHEITERPQERNHWVIFSSNLLGDPEMQVRTLPRYTLPWGPLTKIPWRELIHWPLPSELVRDPRTLAEVHVTLQQGDRVEDAAIDAEGRVIVDASGFTPGEVVMTVSGPDFAPLVRRIPVRD